MFVAVAALAAGCTDRSGAASPKGNGNSTAQSNGSSLDTRAGNGHGNTTAGQLPTVDAADIDVQPVDETDFQAVLEEHRGKFILVDAWATWCHPCREGFPYTVELARKYPDKLAVISLSFDEPEQEEEFAKVVEFLAGHPGPVRHLISAYGGSEESYTNFRIEGGALPNIKIYDPQGNLVKTFSSGDPDNVWDHTDVEAAVEKLLSGAAE